MDSYGKVPYKDSWAKVAWVSFAKYKTKWTRDQFSKEISILLSKSKYLSSGAITFFTNV